MSLGEKEVLSYLCFVNVRRFHGSDTFIAFTNYKFTDKYAKNLITLVKVFVHYLTRKFIKKNSDFDENFRI